MVCPVFPGACECSSAIEGSLGRPVNPVHRSQHPAVLTAKPPRRSSRGRLAQRARADETSPSRRGVLRVQARRPHQGRGISWPSKWPSRGARNGLHWRLCDRARCGDRADRRSTTAQSKIVDVTVEGCTFKVRFHGENHANRRRTVSSRNDHRVARAGSSVHLFGDRSVRRRRTPERALRPEGVERQRPHALRPRRMRDRCSRHRSACRPAARCVAWETGLLFGWRGRPCVAAFMLLERLIGITVRLDRLTQPARETHWVNPASAACLTMDSLGRMSDDQRRTAHSNGERRG